MSDKVEDLEPVTRDLCEKFLHECALRGYDLRVTHTLRTRDEQLHLYAQGRRRRSDGVWVEVEPRRIVTKAMPGQSPHNFGMAFDICWRGGDPYLHTYLEHHGDPDPRWVEIGRIGEGLGLNWGGPLGEGDRFTWDSPHFEIKNWKVHAGRFA